ncbi:MAG: presqualene diphosphate synthase HpnD [Verrucomicrobiales bacterium]|nr:presqualene diphosphate synthase HpnD [Verrucomicrobiales bacterium]
MSASISHAITRKSASNLAFAFGLLPPAKRRAMSALYAFCREVDDVADEESRPTDLRRQQLAGWRRDVRAACDGQSPSFPVNRELQPAIQRYRLPFALFDEIIQGCEMDLDTRGYADWPDLERYCHHVASAVGLLSIEIFGYRHPGCRDYAVALGQAFQLTNILRDVHEDAARGRIYLPQSELERCHVTPDEILSGRYSSRFRALAEAGANRARAFYQRAAAALPAEDRRAMIAAELMGAVYWQLLLRLEARAFDVFGAPRVRLPLAAKLRLVARTWWRLRIGPFAPNYGSA